MTSQVNSIDPCFRTPQGMRGIPPPPGGNEHPRLVAPDHSQVHVVTRLLLENATFSEPVTLQRCARPPVGQLAAWVFVGVEQRGRPAAAGHAVIGPDDPEAAEQRPCGGRIR